MPSQASIGDALSVRQRGAGYELLRAGHQISLQHQANDPVLAMRDLIGNVSTNDWLPRVVFVAIGMTAIDHYARLEPSPFEPTTTVSHRVGGVVHSVAPAAKDHMAIGITRGREDRRLPVLGVS